MAYNTRKRQAEQNEREFERLSFKEKLIRCETGSERFMQIFKTGEHRISNKNVPIIIHNTGLEMMQRLDNFHESAHLVLDSDGLEMKMPPLNFDNVGDFFDTKMIVSAIDSRTQHTRRLPLHQLINSIKSGDSNQVLNLLSLETSSLQKISKEIEVPRIAGSESLECSMEIHLWQKLFSLRESLDEAVDDEKQAIDDKLEHIKMVLRNMPRVEKFVLFSAKESYTDAHIDFAATATFNHVLVGKKVFYVAPPTERNLRVYEAMQMNEDQIGWNGDSFVSEFTRVEIKAGETFFMPPGWLHAVYTPEKSIVVGGNFLVAEKIPLSIRLASLEQKCVDLNILSVNNLYPQFWFILINYAHFVLLPTVETRGHLIRSEMDVCKILVSELLAFSRDRYSKLLQTVPDDGESYTVEFMETIRRSLQNLLV